MRLTEAQEVISRPSRLRKAWCELTGGHDNIVNGAYSKRVCWAFNLHCRRCGKTTRWYDVPRQIEAEARHD